MQEGHVLEWRRGFSTNLKGMYSWRVDQ